MIKFIEQEVFCLSRPETYKYFIKDIEDFARTCFQSEGDKGEDFVRSIMSNHHESVLEHFNLTFSFITSRSMANALVRHRHCAYTQESTHYIDYIKRDIPFQFIKPISSYPEETLLTIAKAQFQNYKVVYEVAGKNTARDFLPLGFKTQLIMTTNLREWRHIIRLRGAFDHPQMGVLITKLYDWFINNLPIFVEDIIIKRSMS